MRMSHKTQIIEGTKSFEAWMAENEIAEKVDWVEFRRLLNELNPEVHECTNDACAVDTWNGPLSNCPACKKTGEPAGRIVK